MDFKKALPIFDRFVSWATPKRILMLAGAAIVTIFSLTIFEQRAQIAEGFTARSQSIASSPVEFKLVLSQEIKDRIKGIVDHSEQINTLQVFNANLRVNERELVYSFTDDVQIELLWKQFIEARGPIQPIFNANEKNNLQMVSTVNGEFTCSKLEDTVYLSLIPKLRQHMPYICRVSLPPYYGEFSGYIMLGLSHAPSDSDVAELRIDAVRLATEIYFKVIAKRK
jgi:hypothetical protein